MEYETRITVTNEKEKEVEIDVIIGYHITESYPATRYQPAEGGELEIEYIYDVDGNKYDEDILSDSVLEELYSNYDLDSDNPDAP